MTRKTLSLFALLLTFVAIGAFAQPASAPAYQSDALESFRADLLNYVSSLSTLPPQLTSRFGADPAALTRAADSIRAMSPEDLRTIKAQMDRVPYWQQLPSVLAAAVQQASIASPSPRALGMSLGSAAQFNNVEMMRQPLLAMVRSF